MKCIICNERQAELPDRNEAPWGKRKKVCRLCHAERLKNDLVNILLTEKKRKEAADATD